MQLQERRLRQRNSTRQTRRARDVVVQRGGFAWTDITTALGPRQKMWQDFFSSDKTFKTSKELELWLNCIIYQDKLITYAFSKLTDSSISTSDATEYFKDIMRLINSTYEEGNVDTDSKFHHLLKLGAGTDNTGLTQSLFKYFPEAFNNSFITSLASAINFLKNNSNQLQVDKTALARYFMSLTQANAFQYTGYEVNDGFYIGMPIKTFDEMLGEKNSFYLDVITELSTLKNADMSALKSYADAIIAAAANKDASEVKKTYISIWRKLTAFIAALHMKGEIRKVLTYFNSPQLIPDTEHFEAEFMPDVDALKATLANNLNIYNIARTLTVGKNVSGSTNLYIAGTSIIEYIIYLVKRVLELESSETLDAMNYDSALKYIITTINNITPKPSATAIKTAIDKVRDYTRRHTSVQKGTYDIVVRTLNAMSVETSDNLVAKRILEQVKKELESVRPSDTYEEVTFSTFFKGP